MWFPLKISLAYLIALFALQQRLALALGQCCSAGDSDCDADDQGLEVNDEGDSVTADHSPGMGVEFETGSITLKGNPECKMKDTLNLKRMVLGGRTGDNWQLTVDTTLESANSLVPEYILDGKLIKIGQRQAGPAAAAVAEDLAAWNPSHSSPPVKVAGSDCLWTVEEMGENLASTSVWQRQITVPMPLEAVGYLISQTRGSYSGVALLPRAKIRTQNLVFVDTPFFQSAPQGVTTNPAPDVLGFFSLVVSYAKAVLGREKIQESAKFMLPFMPRNDFQTLFDSIRDGLGDVLEAGPDVLYNIVNTLACYEWQLDEETGDYYEDIDPRFCSGTPDAPQIGTKLDETRFLMTNGKDGPPPSFTIKEWMNDLQASEGDRLSRGDQTYDSQIGNFTDRMEYVFGTTRLVPLFEFRDLGGSTSSEWEALITTAEDEVVNLHQMFQAPPRIPTHPMRRSKRQQAECSSPSQSSSSSPSSTPSTLMTITSPPTTTQAGPTPSCDPYGPDPDQGINTIYCLCDESLTLPTLSATAYNEYCTYTALPTSSLSISRPVETWTSNCEACTLTGGIADHATCTTVDGCTPTTPPIPSITAWVGNLRTIPIGDADDKNGGQFLAQELYDGLSGFCNETGCSGDDVLMESVETIIDGGEIELKLAMHFSDASYENLDDLHHMLSLGIGSWLTVINKTENGLCQDVDYEADEDPTESAAARA
ncbi:hypothetical protein GGR57DRAFT_512079 [Xylariaceae sp. FL1272]|nr:hypothetical protein GGR57DRAFT_512079 [Xylariaceae sp. FL1272]